MRYQSAPIVEWIALLGGVAVVCGVLKLLGQL